MLLLTAASVAFCIFSSSLDLSIWRARAMSEVNIVMAISITGSAIGIFTPLSSEDRIFFIQSSGLMAVSGCTLASDWLALLYCAVRSFPLLRTCNEMFPFCAISARYAAGSISLFVPSVDMDLTPKWRCSPVVRYPVFPEMPSFCPAAISSPTLTDILSRCM